MSTKRKAAPFALPPTEHCTKLEFLEILQAHTHPDCVFEAVEQEQTIPLGIVVRLKIGGGSFTGTTTLKTRANAVRMAAQFHEAVKAAAEQM